MKAINDYGLVGYVQRGGELSSSDFLDNLSISCDVCDINPESCRLLGHLSESELRKEIEETYLQIQKFLEE